MFNKSYFENSVTNGIPLLEVVGGLEETEHRPPSGVPFVVPLTRTALHGEIMGPLAALRLTQHFLYSSEISDKVLEALYRFPLPGDAAVSNVRVRFGEVEIVAQLLLRVGGEVGEGGEIAGLAKSVANQIVNDGRGGIAFAPDLERVGDGAVHILHHLCDFSAHCC